MKNKTEQIEGTKKYPMMDIMFGKSFPTSIDYELLLIEAENLSIQHSAKSDMYQYKFVVDVKYKNPGIIELVISKKFKALNNTADDWIEYIYVQKEFRMSLVLKLPQSIIDVMIVEQEKQRLLWKKADEDHQEYVDRVHSNPNSSDFLS